MARRKSEDKIQVISNVDESIREVTSYDLVKSAYLEYGSYINNWRQLPQILDGFKISYRRLLYSALQFPPGKMIKSANLLGKMMECFTGDTEVLDVNGNSYTILEIDSMIDRGIPVYTFSCDRSGTPSVTKVLDVINKGMVNDLIKVTLDNGRSFRCTPDHKIMLRTGVWIKARDLKIGSSLMPVYLEDRDDGSGNIRRFIKTNQYDRYARDLWTPVYRLSSDHYDSLSKPETLKGENDYLVTHHSDFDSLNDNPPNLVKIGCRYHRSLHGSVSLSEYNSSGMLSERNKIKWRNGEYNESSIIKAVKESNVSRGICNSDRLSNVRFLPNQSVIPEINGTSARTLYTFIELMNLAVNDGVISMDESTWSTYMKMTKFPTKHSLKWAIKSKYSEMILSYGIDVILEYFPEVTINKCPKATKNSTVTKAFEVIKSIKLTEDKLTPENFDKKFIDLYKKRVINYSYISSHVPELVSRDVFDKIGTKVTYKSNNLSIISSDKMGNHKVSNIEEIHFPEGINVYDLSVDDNNHNFTLSAGVQVHNCHP